MNYEINVHGSYSRNLAAGKRATPAPHIVLDYVFPTIISVFLLGQSKTSETVVDCRKCTHVRYMQMKGLE